MNNICIRFKWPLLLLLVVPVLYWGIYSPGQRTLTVAGNSMSPTLTPGDKVQLQTHSDEALKHGELVAIQFKTRKRPMLKRIIALEGDQVEFVDDRLKLNGKWLDTPWWPGDKRLAARHYKLLAIQLSRYDNRIPKGNLIVMGDNSNKSFDSGDYGMISAAQLLGRVTKK